MPSLAAALAIVAGVVPVVLGQDAPISGGTPLASKHFTWGALPYQVDTDPTGRGPQSGYNLCNSTTAGPASMCQTAVINSIDDFCLWGPPTPGSTVGDTEAASVAWCTKPDYGTRVIPQGALTGVQFMKTPDYVQVTGWIRQELIDLAVDDGGGELDPHGADERGNPLGALVFSQGFNGQWTQANEWHNFMGGGQFCLKACDPAGAHAADYCQHIFDRIGCAYNAPAAYINDTFTSCLGDDQDFPGIYTGDDGHVTTYSQPPESLGPISTMPYTARIPASSSCTTYQSAQLYASAPAPSVAISYTVSGATTPASGAGIPHITTHATTSHTTTTNGTHTNGASSTAVSFVALAGAALVAAIAL